MGVRGIRAQGRADQYYIQAPGLLPVPGLHPGPSRPPVPPQPAGLEHDSCARSLPQGRPDRARPWDQSTLGQDTPKRAPSRLTQSRQTPGVPRQSTDTPAIEPPSPD
ncbi:hypothetical protein AAFF_G00424280 [Aldrovandia affinis]|uniref:Uncharacterized protein n=1 Tax=Aldrovandia affinis TaxID=143900 RepID=A0AAD7T761_9TELE|nr:hypothetical protein AAFF_G00424280 [Aldrovandia affinis]